MATTDSTERLSFWQKAAYAIGDLGSSVGPGTIIPFWYSIFLTDIVRLDLKLVSLFWLIVTLWDAVNDPLFGFLSDHTRSRWGRRRPYLLFGAVPFGLFFALLWFIPPTQNQVLLFAYYTIAYILYEAAATAIGCPYNALMPELTLDQDERTSLVTYRMAVSIGTGLAAPLLIGLVIFPMFPARSALAYQTIGLISGLSFIPPLLITFFGTRERAEFQSVKPLPLRQAMGFVARNQAFWISLALKILSWMPVTIVSAVFAYYLIYWTGMTEDETSITQGVILAAALLTLPLISWLAKRMEKHHAYMVAAATWVLVMVAIFPIPQGAKLPIYIVAVLAGLGVASAHVLPNAIGADVMEVDELMSGRRQEGAYSGISVFIDKLARMIILAILPIVLRWARYVQPTDADPFPAQPASALLALRIFVAIVPAVLLLVSIVIAYFYPLTRARYAEIERQLAERRAKAAEGETEMRS
ncbi:MAG: MFS transporter [Anaerolineae bacterium]|nr:MFS transporter [Anaerolineae bacterium]